MASQGCFSSALHVSAWESVLKDDPDRDFLLDGIKHGFHIVTENINIENNIYTCKEHVIRDKSLCKKIVDTWLSF